MGLRLIDAAYDQWAGILNDKPLLALIVMCRIARDPDPIGNEVPIYWGGWEYVAAKLGCDLRAYDEISDEADRLRRNAKRTVERATNELRNMGAIELRNYPRPGSRAEYILNVRPVDNWPQS